MYYQAEDSRKGGYYFGERLRVEDPKIKFRSNQPSRSPSICRPAPRGAATTLALAAIENDPRFH